MTLTLQRPSPQTQGLGSRSSIACQMSKDKLGGIVTLLLVDSCLCFAILQKTA